MRRGSKRVRGARSRLSSCWAGLRRRCTVAVVSTKTLRRLFLRSPRSVAGLFFVLLSVAGAAGTRSWVSRAAQTEGTVVHEGVFPEISFQTPSGRVRFLQRGLLGRHKGERVSVLYDPDSPSETRCVDEPVALWLSPFLFAALGGTLLVLGARASS